MIPTKLKTLIDQYYEGINPTDEQLDEIMSLALSLSADSSEVSEYIQKRISDYNKQECEAVAKRKATQAKRKERKVASEKDIKNAILNVNEPYVDLGLSVLWAKHNLGSRSSSDLGNYYSWGETKNKFWGEFERDKYKFGYDAPFSKYQPIEKVLVRKHLFRPNEYKTVGDGLAILEPCDDAAHKKLKGKWRIPTAHEFQELLDSCTVKRTREGSKMGYRFSSKIDGFKGNAIFLPNNYIDCYEDVDRDHFGGYWSSMLDDENPDCALCMTLSYHTRPDIFTHSRFSWGLIRPVMDKN